MNITNDILRHARIDSQSVALISPSRSITYGHLGVLVRSTAAHLQSLGVGSGDKVVVRLTDDIDHIVILLASACIGAVSISLDFRSKRDEMARILERFEPAVALTNRGFPDTGSVPILPVDADWKRSVSTATIADTPPRAGWDAPLFINLSSGSTGEPRGIVVTHGQWYLRSTAYRVSLGLGRGHRYFSALPLSFTLAKEHVMHHLLTGNTVIFYPQLFSAEEFIDAINHYRATAAALVPSVVRTLLDFAEERRLLMPGVTSLDVSGAPIAGEEKVRCLERLTPNTFVSYGATGIGKIAVQDPASIARDPQGSGLPAAGTLLEIEQEHGEGPAFGRPGLIRCKSASMASGFGDDEQDAAGHESFRGGWYYPGELAIMREDGSLRLLGRSSNRIIRGGISLYPEEIEQVLGQFPSVSEAAVAAIGDGANDDEIIAFLVVSDGFSEPELVQYLNRRLSSYKVPQKFRYLDSLPKTASGKIARAALPPLA